MTTVTKKFDASDIMERASPLATLQGQSGATGMTAKAPSVETAGPAPTTPANAFSMKGLG